MTKSPFYRGAGGVREEWEECMRKGYPQREWTQEEIKNHLEWINSLYQNALISSVIPCVIITLVLVIIYCIILLLNR